MATCRLFRIAEEELEDIWLYTYEKWGEKQADSYIYGLYDCMEKLATKTLLWRTAPRNLCVPPDIPHAVYFYHYQRHYLFFRELQNGDIGIISILHDAMEIPVRLAQDLEELSKNSTSMD